MKFVINPESIIHTLSQPWHWFTSGLAIAIILFLMTWLGRKFGVSTAFRDLCTLAGAGKRYKFFDIDLKDQYWRMLFVLGAITGGFITSQFLMGSGTAAISPQTVQHLNEWGIEYPVNGAFLPEALFNLSNPFGVLLTVIGSFLVGFGARYGAGCTSGHAITGLAHLQLPSLITVIGFFIGGLTMTWIIMPFIFG